jgi:hypothetical protein
MTGIDSAQRLSSSYGCGAHPAVYNLRTEASLRGQSADRSADYSSPSGAEIKNECSYYPTPPTLSVMQMVDFPVIVLNFPPLLCSDPDPLSGSLLTEPASLYFVPLRFLPL